MNIRSYLMSFVLLFTMNYVTNAQKLTVENATVNYEENVIPAVKVVMNPAPKKSKEEFKDYIKDRFDVKMKGIGFLSNKDVLSAEAVSIPAISDKSMDFHAKVVENGGVTEMYVFGKLGYDVFITPESNKTAYRSMKNLTVEFLNDFLPDYYKNRIDEAQDKLSDLKDDHNNLKDDIEDNKEKIVDLEKENKDMTNEMNELAEEIKSIDAELEKRRNSLDNVNKRLDAVSNK